MQGLPALATSRMSSGIAAALVSALLFGISTPLAKILVAGVPPVALAGLLYLGSGIGLLTWRSLRQWASVSAEVREAPLAGADWGWMAAAILVGGVVAPVLLMWGLVRTPGSNAALLLNLEAVFTALLAWFVFQENVDRRVAVGLFLIAAGGMLLSWGGAPIGGMALGAWAVAGACFAWALDNNLTRRVSARDPVQVAGIKGAVAGSINLALAMLAGWYPSWSWGVLAALAVGFVGYGVSLSLFVWALRHLGTARTGAYFSVAPFFGAAAAIVILEERPGMQFWVAAALMVIGVWLHITERHSHLHRHERLVHSHRHRHDEHHQHEHDESWDGTEPHTHVHEHTPVEHSHPHYPDLHHRHAHRPEPRRA